MKIIKGGMLIVFEGIDGASKSTQSKILYENIKRKYSVIMRSYPDISGRYGTIINEFLHKRCEMSVEEQFLLFLCDIMKDLADLSRYQIVIVDRYYPSTIAYQCASSFSYEKAKDIIRLLSLPTPDVLFYLHIPVDEALRRKKDSSRFENAQFLRRVQKLYERMIDERFPCAWTKISATENVSTIAANVLNVVEKHIARCLNDTALP
ncbi:MAG: dTMP kinase [Canidatus Methanoxibalbensis ujae]|nr:dTMP kinase [Candidatus Methanoxibalbensis ujae]